MRLESVEGIATLTNANGKTLSVRAGMKLYSGYTIATDAQSYAYVSLDSSKVVKLDANSQVEIRKQGETRWRFCSLVARYSSTLNNRLLPTSP